MVHINSYKTLLDLVSLIVHISDISSQQYFCSSSNILKQGIGVVRLLSGGRYSGEWDNE